jgi:hypothetical protein
LKFDSQPGGAPDKRGADIQKKIKHTLIFPDRVFDISFGWAKECFKLP